MPQVLKENVRARIEDAALRCFADNGYVGTSMAAIAAAAGTAPGNVYRYYPSKEVLFDTVVPGELAARHDELLDIRVAALAPGAPNRDSAAEDLIDFWLDHRHAVVVLLDRADGTPFVDYPTGFVQRLTDHVERALPRRPSPVQRQVLELVFDGTRRAIARILATPGDREHVRALITGFWSYQVPGVEGLLASLTAELTRGCP